MRYIIRISSSCLALQLFLLPFCDPIMLCYHIAHSKFIPLDTDLSIFSLAHAFCDTFICESCYWREMIKQPTILALFGHPLLRIFTHLYMAIVLVNYVHIFIKLGHIYKLQKGNWGAEVRQRFEKRWTWGKKPESPGHNDFISLSLLLIVWRFFFLLLLTTGVSVGHDILHILV